MLISHVYIIALAQSQDVTVPNQTPGQFWFAVVIVILGVAASLLLWYRTDFSGLPDDQQQHKSDLRQQRQVLSPVSLRIPATADVSEYWPALSDRIDSVEDSSDDDTAEVGAAEGVEAGAGEVVEVGVGDRTSTTQALAEARSEIGRAWDPLVSRIPRRARQAIELGVLLTLFGAIAVSTSAVVATLQRGPGMPGLPQVLENAVSLTQSVFSAGVDVLTAFPFAGAVWSFAFAYTIMALEWVYAHWYVTATLVILGGLAFAVFEWRAEGDDSRELYDRRYTTLSVVGATLLIWAIGTVPAALGAAFVAVGETAGVASAGGVVATIGAVVGFLLALGTAVTLGVGALAGLAQDVCLAAGAGVRLQRVARYRPGAVCRRLLERTIGLSIGEPALPQLAGDRNPDWSLVGSIILRRALNVANGVLVVVLGAYIVVSLVDGRLMRVLAALANAPGDTQLLVAVAVAVPLAVLAIQARAVWPDLKTALVESFARQRVRVTILGRAIPSAGVAGAYVVAYQLFQSIPIALLVAVMAGVALYGIYSVLLKSQYRVSILDWNEPLPSETLVQVYPPLSMDAGDDDDGRDRRYYAVVNGTAHVLWHNRDEFESFLQDAVVDCRDEDGTPCSLGTWHARDALQFGIVDPDTTAEKVDEKIRKHTVQPLREANGAIQRTSVLDGLDRFPNDRREQRWGEWFEDGILREVDDLLVLGRDPWHGSDHL